MEGGGTFARVGLLIVASVVGIVAMVWFFGGRNAGGGQPFETYFSESVQGLDIGTPVKFRGVTLGRVTQIGLVSAVYDVPANIDTRSPTSRLVYVRFTLDLSKIGREVNTSQAVANGLRARLATQGLTGLSYVELDFVQPSRYPPLQVPWKPENTYIPSIPSTLVQVQDAAQQILNRLQGVDFTALADAATGLINDLRANLKDGDVHNTLAHATALMQSLQDQVQRADLPGLSADLRQTSTALRGTIDSRQVHEILTNTSTATGRLADAAAKLPAMIAELQRTIARIDRGTADVQRDLLPLLRDARAAASNLRDTTEQLRRAPAQTLLGGPPPRTTDDGR